MPCLIEPRGIGGQVAADAGETDRRLDRAEALHQDGLAGGRDAKQRPERVVAPVEDRPGSESGEAPVEGSLRCEGGEHEVRRREVAAQRGGLLVELRPGLPGRELLEEILDQVPLGQAIDQRDLLDRDCGLVRDRLSERELACPLGDEQAEHLVAGRERHGEAAASPALGELRERERLRGLAAGRRRGSQPELVGCRRAGRDDTCSRRAARQRGRRPQGGALRESPLARSPRRAGSAPRARAPAAGFPRTVARSRSPRRRARPWTRGSRSPRAARAGRSAVRSRRSPGRPGRRSARRPAT